MRTQPVLDNEAPRHDLSAGKSISSSTSDITVVDRSVSDEPVAGLKRRRDDLDPEDLPAPLRLKTVEADEVSKSDGRTLSWFLLPWEAFKQGFRESMKS